MAQFIHLSLLLVTQIWLREGSSVTFRFPQPWTVKVCCRDDNCQGVTCECQGSSSLGVTILNKETVTINNLNLENNGNNLCCKASHPNVKDQCLNLMVTEGCIKSYLPGVDFSKGRKEQEKNTAADCRKLCTEEPTCQYFTFHTKNNKCFLMSSSDVVEIKYDTHTVSGYSLKNCSNDTNGLQFYQEPKTWIDALEFCYSVDSILVQITNDTVQEAVNNLLNKNDLQNGVWIGLERSIFGYNIPWKWTSGNEANNPLWNGSSPVDRLNNHCGKIIRVEKSQEYKWLDARCHEKLPFICQGTT